MPIILYQVILATIVIGFIEGSEIALFTVAAASKYKWRKAWMITLAGLATLIPLIAVIYFVFDILPLDITLAIAAIIIFLLGAHFFQEGYEKRTEKHSKKEEKDEIKEEIGVGMIGVYSAILLEEVEAGSISMSIGAASGGAYVSAVIGMLIGLLIPLIAIKGIEPFIEKLPEWAIQLTIGSVMMVVAVAIALFHF
jgi:uncharacterized membrane protein